MRLIDLFGFYEIVIKCTSGEEMYEVANKAKDELDATNHSVTIARVTERTYTREVREDVWQNSDYKWISIRDCATDGIHMYGIIASEAKRYLSDQIISAEEYFNTFTPQPTMDEQEFSDAFCELIQGVANG